MRTRKLNFKPIWLIAPAIVAAWILVVFFIKDVYPFGQGTIIAYDLRHGGVPAMYYVWDVFHSGDFSRLFYDFTTAGGFARESLLNIFYPQYWFLLLWDRENLDDAVSVLFVVKMALVAFTSSVAFSKIFPKLKAHWLTVISVMYAFCGYNIMYFTNIDWLDTVALYPLLIVFALNMFKGKSKIPFFLVLTYLLSFATYMAFFVVVSLVVFGGLYIYLIEEKANRKNAVYSLGIGTGAALLSSVYPIFSFAKGIFSTARFDEGSYVLDAYSGQQKELSGYFGILDATNQIDIVSVFMFLGMALAIASLIVIWVRFKKHKQSRKFTIFFTVTILLFVLQIILKSVMLLWHAGSYQMFPFRNGYMVAFFCCCIIGYYYSEFSSSEGLDLKSPILNFLTFIPCFFAGLIAASYVGVFTHSMELFNVLNSLVNFQTQTMKYPYGCLVLAVIAFFLLVKLIKYEKIRNLLSIVMVIAMLGVNTASFIARCTCLTDGSLYQKEKELNENIDDRDAFQRVNNEDAVLMLNYGYVADVPVLANWTHSLNSKHLKSFSDLGYNTEFTYMTGVGGTVFSEALLRVTDTVSEFELHKELYDKYFVSELGMNYYKNNYVLPLGLVFDKNIKNVNADDFKNTFDYQEALYNSLTGDEGLFEKVSYKKPDKKIVKDDYFINVDKEDGSGRTLKEEKVAIYTYTYTLEIEGKKVLYLGRDKDTNSSFNELKINGKSYQVFSSQSESDIGAGFSVNTEYPNEYNNGPLELGVFEGETVEISIKLPPNEKNSDNFVFYTMDLEKMEKLCNHYGEKSYTVDGNKISLSATSEETGILLIPLSYDKNWKGTVNGENAETVCVMGNFLGVEVPEGENDVVVDYSVKQTFLTYILRMVFFVLGLAFILIEKKIKMPKQIYTLTFIAFTVIFIGGMVVLYALPIGWSVVKEIIDLIK